MKTLEFPNLKPADFQALINLANQLNIKYSTKVSTPDSLVNEDAVLYQAMENGKKEGLATKKEQDDFLNEIGFKDEV